ncbi:hypothetical protein N7533_008373 [Penicillium manginii]|uniref:uncharacterized protein n=1 Tax=Penicillium manginii TaxID=203109 RepID=UPI0025474BA3|nr:uncharacterized protein N7533_008373 [Penicillium manginii]KAJ5751345.1 hypothetical protein N7533_008373 [Penicillium manginii]
MDHSTHIIDPDGEVIIVLQNANSPFAHPPEDDVPEDAPPEDAPPEDASPEDDAPGDGIVEVQPCERMDEGEFRIQVSAKHMMFASSFFKRCLTGAWKESEAYQQKGLVEVTAEGWDSEALLIIIRAIHCQYSLIPKKVTLDMLAKIAAIADYYDCKDVLYIFTDIWFSSLDKNVTASSQDLELWLWVSWFFKHPTQFKEASSTAMSWSEDLIDVRGLPIPNQIIGKIRYWNK